MDITRRCDYALRILRVAYERLGSFVSVTEIAELEDIPYAFARSIQHDLVRAGLLRTSRGARGGLALNCDPQSTTISTVIEAVDGPISVAACTTDTLACEKQDCCNYNKLWAGANRLLREYFSSITLSEILEQGEYNPVVQAAHDLSFGTLCEIAN